MDQSNRIFRLSFSIAFGTIIAAALGLFASLLWRPLFWPVFLALSICWLWLAVEAMRRLRSGEHIALLAESRRWESKDLPAEFQFIDRNTTVREINERIGRPPDCLRGEGDVRALQYDLPYNCALLVFPQPPFDLDSRVRGVKFYRNRTFIPLFP